MGDGECSKTPTWQWIAGMAISILLVLIGASVSETRSDIKEVAKANIEVCTRVTALETASRIQFEAIKEWRSEIKGSLDKISGSQEKTAGILNKSAMTLKEWQKIK